MDTKISIKELQSTLDNMVLPDNLNNSEILDLSRKLDSLILQYYRENKKDK